MSFICRCFLWTLDRFTLTELPEAPTPWVMDRYCDSTIVTLEAGGGRVTWSSLEDVYIYLHPAKAWRLCSVWLQSVSAVNSTELERIKEVVCWGFFPFIKLQEFSLTSTPAALIKLVHTGLKSKSGISSKARSLILRNKPDGTNIKWFLILMQSEAD